MSKSSNKTVTKKIATKPRGSATEGDDIAITAFALPPEPLSPEMAAYFKKCEEKLGFGPTCSRRMPSTTPSFQPLWPCTMI